MTEQAQNIINWFEISVTDMAKSVRLYEAMLDTKIPVSDFGGIPHGVIANADHSCTSGALIVDPKRARGAGTVLYFRAPDGVKACVSRAVEAGAKVVQPFTEIGPHGAIALLADLDGNVIGLHQEPAS
jgi:hypothetical protein